MILSFIFKIYMYNEKRQAGTILMSATIPSRTFPNVQRFSTLQRSLWPLSHHRHSHVMSDAPQKGGHTLQMPAHTNLLLKNGDAPPPSLFECRESNLFVPRSRQASRRRPVYRRRVYNSSPRAILCSSSRWRVRSYLKWRYPSSSGLFLRLRMHAPPTPPCSQ